MPDKKQKAPRKRATKRPKKNVPGERLTGSEAPNVIERHVGRYKRAIEMAGRTGGVWWDAACGSGYGTVQLPADGAYGFDKEFPGDTYRASNVSLLVADLSEDGWSNDAPDPDVVLSIETLEHLSRHEQGAFLSEIARRLKPDGVFVLMCPIGNGANPDNPWHMHEPTRKELRRLLSHRFNVAPIGTERYESTSGPAIQAWAICRDPI